MATFVANQELAGQWYAVAESIDLDAGPIGARLLAIDYVIWRSPDGSVTAAPDRCPHRESPLSIGTVVDGKLTCPYHGWEFGDGGACVRIPSNGDSTRTPPAANLSETNAEERYGLVWLCPSDPVGSIPEIAHESDPTFRRINTGVDVWKVSVTRMTDNFLDISHFPFVHSGTFGSDQHETVPKLDLGELDNGWFGYSYDVTAVNPQEAQVSSESTEATVERKMSTGFHLPFTVRSTIAYESGLEHILLLVSTPIDDENSYFTFVVWRNDDFSTDPQEAISFDRAIGAEDKLLLEQLPGVLSFDQTGLASVASDKASVEWRRRLLAMMGV